jgi:two-component system, NtrC family, sensor kinase
MTTAPLTLIPPSRWELAAETIAVKIRWFGLVIGYVIVNVQDHPLANVAALNAILCLGLAYAIVDSYYSYRGRIFLAKYPIAISMMEAIFIGLLCYYDIGLESPFRYYYLLSLIVCAIRYPPAITYMTCAIHCGSYAILYLLLQEANRQVRPLVLLIVVLCWVAWAANALALLLKQVGNHLHALNGILQRNQQELEERIAERTRELQETQAHLLHQEKMAAFGLLAAGIAHEVGNPLTSISSLVQMVQRHEQDPYTQEKLALVSGQLERIQGTLRELINFSRPAATERIWVPASEIVQEALNIAKYYKPTRGKTIQTVLPAALPPVLVVRDQLIQAVLNLVLNAIDATPKGGLIEVRASSANNELLLEVEDDGHGIQSAGASKLFQPYFTTKPNGTGLGLFVTRKLVAEHEGTVDFESVPHQKTIFRIHLPLR